MQKKKTKEPTAATGNELKSELYACSKPYKTLLQKEEPPSSFCTNFSKLATT